MSSSIQKDNIYLVPSSEKIILSKNFDGKYFSKVNLNNITHNFIIFKVFINKEQLYSANPSVGFIEPKGNLQITIKRILNDSNDENMIGGDKFMIKAYISHRKLTDIDEVKKLITQEDLQSPLTQALIMLTEISNENILNNTLQPQRTIRDSFLTSDLSKSDLISEDKRSIYSESQISNRDPTNIEEWKKKIEERRLQIKDLEHENEKLILQKNNLIQNSKNHSKKVNVMNEKDKPVITKNTYPLFFMIFVSTIGVIFGAFLNKFI